ncbi:MAG: hypothetical protein FJ280_08285 [Planctomycetes bacterium]|nr:hypothetical protein [Planctomycetota bacterium]
MERRREFETRRLRTVVFFWALALLLFAVGGCDKQLTRMEENHVRLQAMVAANARELATLSEQLHAGQGKINESIQALDADTRQVAAGVAVVQNEQRRLQETVTTGHEGLQGRIAQVQDTQHALQGQVTRVAEVTQGTAGDLTSLAREHAALYRTVQANQQELTGGLASVVGNQQRIQTGIGDLRQAGAALAGDIDAKHDTLCTTLRDNHQQLAERLGSVHLGQGQLVADIANVHTLVRTMAADLLTAHASMSDQLGANQEDLTRRIAGLSAGQERLQAGVGTLGGKADQAAAQLADTRSSLQETLHVSREVLTGQMAATLQNQQAMHTDVRDLGEKADKLAMNIDQVATEQTALHAALRANHDVVITAMAGLSDRHETLRHGLNRLDGKTDQVVAGLGAVTAQQQSLRQTVTSNHEIVAGNLAGVSETQTKLQTGVDRLDDKAEAIAAAQDHLRQTLQSQHRDMHAGIAGLAADQQTLRTQMEALAATSGQTARDVLANNTALTTRTAELAENQQTLKSGLDRLGQTTQQMATDVARMNAGQEVLHQALKTHSDKADRQVAGLAGDQEEMKAKLADNQRQMQESLDALAATTGQATLELLTFANSQVGSGQALQTAVAELGTRTGEVATKLANVAAGQSSLQDTLDRQGQAASARMTKLAEQQQQVQESLNTVTALTGQATLDVLALGQSLAGSTDTVRAGFATLGAQTDAVATKLAAVAAGQNSLSDALTRQGQGVSAQVARLAEEQQQVRNDLETLTALNGQTALDLLSMATRQDMIRAALPTYSDSLGTRLDLLADGQQQMHSGLDMLTATAGQTALDVLTMTTRQEAIRTALQSHDEASHVQLTQLVDQQQQMHSGLDIVTATTGQAALDTLALSSNQAQLGQAIQAGRRETADRLAALTQGQRSWSERLDAAQVQVVTLAGGIAALEQQIAGLQNLLLTGLQSTTALVDTTGQQRRQFEAKVSQDIQAVIESLGQLRQTQASLQEQILQVQKNTQGQTESIQSVLDQIKQRSNVNDRVRDRVPPVDNQAGAAVPAQPPAEVRVSSAAEKAPAPRGSEAAE